MRIVQVLGTLITCVYLIACGPAGGKKTSSEVPDDWKTFTENNYSIQHPNSWEVSKSRQMGTSFILYSPLTSAEDPFRENVNLIVQDLAGKQVNLDGYVTISEEQIKTMMKGGTILASERITKETLPYHKVIYTGILGEYDLKFEQYYWIVAEKAYVLTLTCEQSQFDAYQATGEQVLNSFQFLTN